MDFKEQLKSSVDISVVVGEYVRLRKAGPQRYMGLCPFHNEKTPSFSVHVAKQFYKCFSCGVGGDVLDFVMRIEGLSFYEALKQVAERNGIPMPKRSVVADEDSRLREAVYRMHEIAQETFRDALASPAGEAARNYLVKRGMAPATAELFGLGYSDKSGSKLLRIFEQQHFTAAQIEESGLVRKRDDGSFYDYFRNRLMFPIHNESGKIIGFGGRALSPDDNPKYLNSPETPIYKKSQVLYNLHRAKEGIRKDDRVILVEGYMDAIGVTAGGFRQVVASCGTSLTTQQVKAIKRFSQRIVVNFDPDAAGANAAEKSIKLLLEEGMEVRIMELDDGLDPDEFCKDRGSAAYQDRLDHAKGYFFWLCDRARKKNDMHTPEGKVAALKSLLPAVGNISDRLERMTIANEVAGYIGVDRGVVLDSFLKAVSDRQEKALERPKLTLRHDEKILLNGLLTQPDVWESGVEKLRESETLGGLSSARIFGAIFALNDAGEAVTFEAVNARLGDADRDLWARAVLNEDAEISHEEVLAAVRSICQSDEQNRAGQLRTRIKELERAGRLPDALTLMAELQKLEAAREPRRSTGRP